MIRQPRRAAVAALAQRISQQHNRTRDSDSDSDREMEPPEPGFMRRLREPMTSISPRQLFWAHGRPDSFHSLLSHHQLVLMPAWEKLTPRIQQSYTDAVQSLPRDPITDAPLINGAQLLYLDRLEFDHIRYAASVQAWEQLDIAEQVKFVRLSRSLPEAARG